MVCWGLPSWDSSGAAVWSLEGGGGGEGGGEEEGEKKEEVNAYLLFIARAWREARMCVCVCVCVCV